MAETRVPTDDAGFLRRRTTIVAGGVAASGAGTVAMLAVVAHASPPRVFATVATWWVAATLLAFPFGVFEAFLARLVVTDVARHRAFRATVGTVTGRAASLAIVVLVVVAVGDPVLARTIFAGTSGLGPLLGVFVLVFTVQAIQRGVATGTDRFDVVALQLASDGVLRTAAVVLAVLLLPDQEVATAAAICLGSAAACVVAHLRDHQWLARPTLRGRDVPMRPIVVLLVGAAGPMLINNASLPWLSAATSSAAVIGAFSGALTMSRVPVQLGSAAFGPLLNQISHAVEDGAVGRLRALTGRYVAIAALIAAAFALAFTVLGPPVLELFIGAQYSLPRWVFASLGASSGLMFVALVVQSRVAAQQQWSGIAGSWLLAAGAFLTTLLLPVGVLQRAALSPLVAAFVGCACLAVLARRGTPRATVVHP